MGKHSVSAVTGPSSALVAAGGRSIYDVMGWGSSSAGPERAPGYLEPHGNTVTGPPGGVPASPAAPLAMPAEWWFARADPAERPAVLPAPHYRVTSVGCRCRFCGRCSYPAGVEVRERLTAVTETFGGAFMVTTTVDQSLFPGGPGEAFDYLKRNRCLARFVRALRKRSDDEACDADGNRLVRMHSHRFFAAIEWQENGWPHFHLLLDASYVDFDEMARLWGRFRPPWAGEAEARVRGGRPAFGSIYFTKAAKAVRGDRKKAAKYVTKYLTKTPKSGWPEWVLERRRVRRYSTSHGFWASASTEAPPECDAGADDCCCEEAESEYCDGCGEHVEECTCPPGTTIRERLATCGTSSALLRVEHRPDEAGRWVPVTRFVAAIPGRPLEDVLEGVAGDERPGKYHWDVPQECLREVWYRAFGRRPTTEEERRDIAARLAPSMRAVECAWESYSSPGEYQYYAGKWRWCPAGERAACESLIESNGALEHLRGDLEYLN